MHSQSDSTAPWSLPVFSSSSSFPTTVSILAFSTPAFTQADATPRAQLDRDLLGGSTMGGGKRSREIGLGSLPGMGGLVFAAPITTPPDSGGPRFAPRVSGGLGSVAACDGGTVGTLVEEGRCFGPSATMTVVSAVSEHSSPSLSPSSGVTLLRRHLQQLAMSSAWA